jgi:hypothetical protein
MVKGEQYKKRDRKIPKTKSSMSSICKPVNFSSEPVPGYLLKKIVPPKANRD